MSEGEGSKTPTTKSASHWTLTSQDKFEPSNYSHILRLHIKLASSSNYVTWMKTIESALDMEDLLEYAEGTVIKPDSTLLPIMAKKWKKVDALVRIILINAMEESVNAQLSHLTTAAEIWAEARRLFAGQTITDYMLTITNLVTAKYEEGEDVTEHIAKFKTWRRDLILMQRDIPDDLYACFLRISMPAAWNYVFAGLPAKYTSAEVERRIKDESGVRKNQETTAAYMTRGAGKSKKTNSPIPGQPFCTNCKKNGHLIADCWSSGGGKEGQGPRQKKKRGDKKDNKDDRRGRDKKGKKRANQVVQDDSESDDDSQSVRTNSTYMATIGDKSRSKWILDGGAMIHICRSRAAFTKFTPTNDVIGHIYEEGPMMPVHGYGEVNVVVNVTGRGEHTITLKNVHYCPKAHDNLISEQRMDKKGYKITKLHGRVKIKNLKTKEIVLEARLRHGLYEVEARPAPSDPGPIEVAFNARTSNIDLWHHRFGHINERYLQNLQRHKMVTGMDLTGTTLAPCHGCAKGKHHQSPFPAHARRRAKRVVERIHCDLQGPFERSINGYTYVLAVVDDYSRKGWKVYLKKKSDTIAELPELIERLETMTDRRVKYIRSDQGGEFVSKKLDAYFRKKGISHEWSAAHTPQQNGVAERFNQTTHEHALSMLHEKNMRGSFWPEAHEYASYTRNRCPTSALSENKTPNEMFHERKPDVSSLRIFGSKCHVRIPPDSRSSKLAPRSLDGIFCGFEKRTKAYKVWVPSQHKFVASRDVIVYEEISKVVDDDDTPMRPRREGVSDTEGTPSTPINEQPKEPSPPIPTSRPTSPNLKPTPDAQTQQEQNVRRTTRVSRPTWKKQANDEQKAREQKAREERRKAKEDKKATTGDETDKRDKEQELVHLAYQAAFGPYTPSSYEEAMRGPYADEWMKAMKEELAMLEERKTWVKEEIPKGRKEVGCRWVYLIKYDANGNIARFKARLVAQGFSQKPGVDFYDTFSPTAAQTVFNVLLHIAASLGWARGQDDVTGAFLHSDLDSVIYMRQPPGFEDGSNQSLRLVRSLYGLKQASHLWNKYMDSKLTTIGFKSIRSDPAVYVRNTKTGKTILAIHVDNMYSIADTPDELKRTRKELHGLFEMKEEDPNWFMGYQLIPDETNHTISISQHHYIESILKRFNMTDCNPRSLPVSPSTNLSKNDGPKDEEEKKDMEKVPYRELVGALLWVSRISRPDNSFGSGYFGRFNTNPGRPHWKAAQDCLRFLSGTKDWVLQLGNPNPDEALKLVGYSDADFAREDDRRSVSGFVYQLGGRSISWGSKKQPTVARSSTEAEYIAAAHAVGEGLWIRNLLQEIGFGQEGPTPLYVDNRSTIAIIENPKQQRTKYIDIKHHFIRDRVQGGSFELIHCPTKNMVADIFTKPLNADLFKVHTKSLGLTPQ